MASETDKPVKKKSVPITDFQKQCRSYFSSLSARGCKYVYLNIPGHENELVVTNADPDLFITYTSLAMISIHCIQPHDDFLVMFRDLFNLNQISNHSYIIKTEFITKAFKDFRIESVLAQIDPITKNLYILGGGKQLTISIERDDDDDDYSSEPSQSTMTIDELDKVMQDDGWDCEIKRSLFTATNIAGTLLKDPFVINELAVVLDQMAIDYKNCTEMPEGHYAQKFDQTLLTKQEKFHSNWYRSQEFSGDQFGLPEERKYQNQKLLLVDGLDLPSVREFIQKKYVKEQFVGDFSLYIYKSNGDTVKCLACYHAPEVSITSTRPYMETVLMPTIPPKRDTGASSKEIPNE